MINKTLLKEKSAEIGINLDELALERFDKYAEMLVETNKVMNLTAITEPDEIIYKHFIDCLSLLSTVDFKNGCKVIDVGTGAGFPGVVLLIARPDLKMTLIDGTNKRLTFIENVLNELDLSAEIKHIRAELAGKDNQYREKFDVVTARAVANLNTLSEYCLPFVKVGGIFAPMKSTKTDDEIKSANNAIKLLGGRIIENKYLNIENCGERYIVITEKISQTPPKYPRASAQINKKPLT
ncbi:MAG: 16S rRNA (guanine(527)-N(7))-methyltransferase RsmG [Ruminococcus sp.]|nr:16S rRNA (guanine(527)-N(7))-methyltransferase RsmG [Candidatus Copronaster equi]